jgi:hypothetical protein
MTSEHTCPKCGTALEPYAEVDIGVGTLQGGPWWCPACHWIEPQESLPDLAERCGASMGRAECNEPKGHDGPHIFEEDFL